jgi:putative membrane protein
MLRALLSSLLALSVAGVALGQDRPPPGNPPPKKEDGQEKKPEPFSDASFVTNANRTNLLEIAMGQLAGTQSMNADVKVFAQKIATDHQKLNADLTDLAARKKINLPGKLTEDEQKMIDDMGKLSGDVFDRRFMAHMVSGHESAVASYKKASTDAKDADIKDLRPDPCRSSKSI